MLSSVLCSLLLTFLDLYSDLPFQWESHNLRDVHACMGVALSVSDCVAPSKAPPPHLWMWIAKATTLTLTNTPLTKGVFD